jgi:integrase
MVSGKFPLIPPRITRKITRKDNAMPRKYLMSWEGPPNYRWVKMYKRVRYRIHCADLGLPEGHWTEERSYQAANEWWGRKRAEIDAAATPSPMVVALEEWRGAPFETELDLATTALAFVQAHEDRPPPQGFAEKVLGEDHVRRLRERAAALFDGPSAPPERTIGGQADRWSTARATEARTGVRSADNAQNQRIALEHFCRFAGRNTPVEAIDHGLWERWYVHCAGQMAKRDNDRKAGWSASYAAKVFAVARVFVRWLHESGVLAELPRNLSVQRHRFERPAKRIETFTNAEIHALLDAASEPQRLNLLLMLNTGCTQKDISDLRKDEIDLRAGTITRRRSKTRNQRHAPTVTYHLWPCTLELLRKHLSADPEIALLTRNGTRWVRKEMHADGRCNKADMIDNAFAKIQKRTGISKPLKLFRKTSATRLMENPRYRDLRHHFLGHAPATVADRHYAAESAPLLAEAVKWLGEQYGL